MISQPPDKYLREEFNRWAEAGRGEEMENHHWPIVEPTLALMDFQTTDRVLDLGCGTGWLCRTIAERVPQGDVVGIDISDEMIRRAETASIRLSNLTLRVGGVDVIPSENGYFSKVISVESAYYWPDPTRGIKEIFRVLRLGGTLWILINYYRDNPYCHQWGLVYTIPTHLLFAEEWAELFHAAGFSDVTYRRIPDQSPSPEVYTGRWFKDANELRKFKKEGALLIQGGKAHELSCSAVAEREHGKVPFGQG